MSERDEAGLPDPADPTEVRQFLDGLSRARREAYEGRLAVVREFALAGDRAPVGLSAALEHGLIRRPGRVSPAPTEAEVAARAWLDGHADTGGSHPLRPRLIVGLNYCGE